MKRFRVKSIMLILDLKIPREWEIIRKIRNN